MTTHRNELRLRTHNKFDGLVSKALMDEHPDWSMETVREAALIATNTLLPLFPVMYTRKELEQAELRTLQSLRRRDFKSDNIYDAVVMDRIKEIQETMSERK